jgi:hypothetical protein
MSRLSELRAKRKVSSTTEKNLYPSEGEPTEPTKGTSVGFVGSIPKDIQFFLQSTAAISTQPEPANDTATLADTVQPPAPASRLCYQCQHFRRSPYGYPLGLCAERGNRIQHSTSRPTQFGCGEFKLRPPDDPTRTCQQCKHYSKLSTMCAVVNVGCPYPNIPPCSGGKFQPVEVRP